MNQAKAPYPLLTQSEHSDTEDNIIVDMFRDNHLNIRA